MPVCNFFLQGRCRYGDKCWNEHPRGGGGGGGGGGGYNNNNRSAAQQQPRGGGGFGNRVWVNPSQQKGGYIQPSSFSSRGTEEWGRGGGGSGGADWGRGEGGGRGGGNDWGRGGGGGGDDWGRGGGGNDWGRGGGGGGGGGGRRDNDKSSEFSFSAQNRFSALGTPSNFDRGGRGGGGGGQQVTAGEEDDDRKLEIIQMDMDVWESSGQWGFSCYSSFKTPLSGFTDLSPEELRLEYYTTRASGDLQSYVNGINQLLNQWRSRVQELKVMNPATRAALLAEINNPAPQASSSGFGSVTGFGSSASGLESKGFGAPTPAEANTFSFAPPSGGFGSSAAPPSSTGFGSALAAPTQPPSGFGSSTAASSTLAASSFSFAAPTSDKPAATSGFGSAAGFSFSSTSNTGGGGGGFGSSFGAEVPAAAGSGSVFGQASGGFGTAAAPPAAGAGSAGGASDSLFSHDSNMTPEELNQFKAKRFTLGQIPLKPPPADMLVV